MALTKYAAKLLAWLDRYKITSDQLIARIPVAKQRGAIIKAALTELAPLELPAPATFTATPQDDRIALAWAAVTGPATIGYVVERATNAKFTTGLTTVYTGTATSYTNTGLTSNKAYYYRMYATSTDATILDTTPNNIIKATATTTAPLAAPATFAASAVAQTTLTLTWAAVTGATGYVVERATNSGFTANLTTVYTGALLTTNQTGLTAETQYYYRVRATASGKNVITYATTNATTTA